MHPPGYIDPFAFRLFADLRFPPSVWRRADLPSFLPLLPFAFFFPFSRFVLRRAQGVAILAIILGGIFFEGKTPLRDMGRLPDEISRGMSALGGESSLSFCFPLPSFLDLSPTIFADYVLSFILLNSCRQNHPISLPPRLPPSPPPSNPSPPPPLQPPSRFFSSPLLFLRTSKPRRRQERFRSHHPGERASG